MTGALSVIRCRYNSLSCWIEAKICLIHKLLIETRIDSGIIVRYGLIGSWSSVRIYLLSTVFEQLVQNALLLLVVYVHAFTLYGAAMRSKMPNGYQHLCKI